MVLRSPLVNPSRRAASLLALLLLIGVTKSPRAQLQAGARVPDGEPARFLQQFIGLSSAQIDEARAGRVVTKVLDTKEKDEVALFGIVTVDVGREDFVQRVRDLPNYLRTPGRAAFGLFSTPATSADVASFVAEQSDLDAIKDCKPGDCDVKMPTVNIEQFRSAIDWSAPATARTKVESLVRERSAVYVNRYRAGGTAAMVEYGDQKNAGRASDVFAALLAQSPYLYHYMPTFHDYLKAYPNGSLPGVTDAIYWATDKLPSLRPLLTLNHVSIYAPPNSALALVTTKQLYASHYFLGAFTLATVLDRPDAPNGKGVYYIVVQRMRFDNLPSGGLLNIRGRVIGRMHDMLRADLTQRKSWLEGRT
jgi:hypothetical protein